MTNPTQPAHYTVNQARSVIRSASDRARVEFFLAHPDRNVVTTATQRLRRPFAGSNVSFPMDAVPPALQVLSQVGTLKTPVVHSLAERYGFPIEVVKATLEAKGGDEKAAARSLSAKKARAAQNKK